jgi:hypothetical protein
VNELGYFAKTEAKRGGPGATPCALGLRVYPRMRVARLFARRVELRVCEPSGRCGILSGAGISVELRMHDG